MPTGGNGWKKCLAPHPIATAAGAARLTLLACLQLQCYTPAIRWHKQAVAHHYPFIVSRTATYE